MFIHIKQILYRVRNSIFIQNVGWVAGLSSVERIAAFLQTILIARALGITEYGVYGLLFGTIGFTASVTGLQMGLTATVFVARYKESNKAKARLVIQYVNRFSLIVSAVFFFVTLPFSKIISVWLLSSDQRVLAIVAGCALVSGSLLSGAQQGVAQGFEDFKAIALIRIITSVFTLLAIYPSAMVFGLEGVLILLLGSLFLQYLFLTFVVHKNQLELKFPKQGSGVKFGDLIMGFSAPSLLVNLLVGLAAWYGLFLLSKQGSGFDEVAIVNTGIQWRGSLLLVSSALGSVAIPAFSKMKGAGNAIAANKLINRLLWSNGVAALGVVIVVTLLADPILGLYGQGFLRGKAVFLILLAATIPQIMGNVYMQNLVGAGKMWLQLCLYIPFFMCSLPGFIFLIPKYSGMGYAVTMMLSTFVFALFAAGVFRKVKVTQ